MKRAQIFPKDDTIVALATAQGVGAIAVIRLSGPQAIAIADKLAPKIKLAEKATHSIHFGIIKNAQQTVDEAVFSLFRGPHSFTKEDVVEISVHGSTFIIEQVLQLCLQLGARMAQPGEFTFRAFMNGRFDLSQAEAVADLIAADNAHAHRVAINQMRGGFTHEIARLRSQLVDFASLLELELDFSEEDVAFADRSALLALLQQLLKAVNQLKASFMLGNVMKQGVATVIAGKPNAGKSTLLNALLKEEKAIVSHIPGTTRDVIEDVISLEGIKFRFYDTAGIREATDMIESIGVSRTFEKMGQAAIILYLFDLQTEDTTGLREAIKEVPVQNARLLLVGNKMDTVDSSVIKQLQTDFPEMLFISAKEKEGMEALQEKLLTIVNLHQLQTETVVANARHHGALVQAAHALEAAFSGLTNQLATDLVAQDIRQCLYYLGEITGEITTDDLLGNIFSKFCIGK